MNFTIEDTRKFISSIYQWMTTNADFDFIRLSIDDCSSDQCIQRRSQLESALRRTRLLLNQLSESLDEMDICIKQLKLSIEKERAIRKKAKIDKKLKCGGK